ncbi:MAG TPA: acyl-CoA dehydrogenase family protein, partial [Rhodanobacter sp.]|nr:acyl-CoA dehydrogenase family protein [Rhodanobacter sp.]
MSLLLNDEQTQLRETAHDFLGERSPVARQRALRNGGDALGFDPALWREATDMGWTAAVFPEAFGGLDFGWPGLAAVFEECGRTLAALPLLSHVVLAGGAVLALGDVGQQQRWLPGIVAGAQRFALAHEESARHAPTQV